MKLCSRGLDVDLRTNDGVTPLTISALKDKKNAFDILIQNGADPSFEENHGFIILHFAAKGGNTSTIIKLLSLGFDVDSRNNFGATLLMNVGGNDKQNAFDLLM